MRVAEMLCDLPMSPHHLTVAHPLQQALVLPEGLRYPAQLTAVQNRRLSGKKMSYLAAFHLATVNNCFMPSWKIYSMLGWVDLAQYHEDVPWEFDPDHHWLGVSDNS